MASEYPQLPSLEDAPLQIFEDEPELEVFEDVPEGFEENESDIEEDPIEDGIQELTEEVTGLMKQPEAFAKKQDEFYDKITVLFEKLLEKYHGKVVIVNHKKTAFAVLLNLIARLKTNDPNSSKHHKEINQNIGIND